MAHINGHETTLAIKVDGITTQAKTVTPTEEQQILTPDDGYNYLSGVTVSAVQTQEKRTEVNGTIEPDSGKYLSSVVVAVPGGSFPATPIINSAVLSETGTPAAAAVEYSDAKRYYVSVATAKALSGTHTIVTSVYTIINGTLATIADNGGATVSAESGTFTATVNGMSYQYVSIALLEI